MTFPDGTFDLVSVTFVLNEMDPEVRSLVERECRRVAKRGERILLIDFHLYPFPRGGLDGLATAEHLCVARKLLVGAGVAAINVIST